MSVFGKFSAAVSRFQERASTDIGTRRGKLALLGLVVAPLIPFVFDSYTVSVATQMLIFILAVASWNLLAGYFGIFSFAHAALFGIGAYTAAILAAEFGVPPTLAIVIGGVAAGIFSIPISLPVLRLAGAYVAMVTLAYAEIIHLGTTIFRDITGGPTGYTNHSAMFGGDRIIFFYFTLLVVVIGLLLLYLLLVSRFGLIARAIRESEDAARALGNDTYRYKFLGFVIGSGLAGVAGGLQAYNLLIVSPPVLGIERMIDFMAMGVIGGFTTFGGAIIGVLAVGGISEILRGFTDSRMLIWGALLLVIILFFPNGLNGTDIREFSLRGLFSSDREAVPEEEEGDSE